MTEKERVAHSILHEFGACQGQAILDRIARWDAETAQRRLNCSSRTYRLPESTPLQTSLPFGRPRRLEDL